MIKQVIKKENLGITLIALVVTIVVLIILAGVAISLSLGENGIFNKAKYATESYSNSQELEMAQIDDYENKIDEYINNDRSNQSNNSFVELTSTFVSKNATFQYPEGYNKDNTYVISAKAWRDGATWWNERYAYGASNNKDEIALTDDGINWTLVLSGVTYTDAKILITKIDI